jgi:hypothetical protein
MTQRIITTEQPEPQYASTGLQLQVHVQSVQTSATAKHCLAGPPHTTTLPHAAPAYLYYNHGHTVVHGAITVTHAAPADVYWQPCAACS